MTNKNIKALLEEVAGVKGFHLIDLVTRRPVGLLPLRTTPKVGDTWSAEGVVAAVTQRFDDDFLVGTMTDETEESDGRYYLFSKCPVCGDFHHREVTDKVVLLDQGSKTVS